MPGPALPPPLLEMPADRALELLCKANPGVWAERNRGFTNSPVHWEWYRVMLRERRLAVVAPREHAKTEIFTVNQTAWRSIYWPGIWTYVFAQTGDQAEKVKERIDLAVSEVHPRLVERARVNSKKETIYANGSAVSVAGAGKAVRGAHPDIIIGDDVLSEQGTLTAYQRQKTSDWWFGTVANMAHAGVLRSLRGGLRVAMPPTRMYLVGTPFHRADLLLGMKGNPLWRFRRYAAEYRPDQLVDGLAVEIG